MEKKEKRKKNIRDLIDNIENQIKLMFEVNIFDINTLEFRSMIQIYLKNDWGLKNKIQKVYKQERIPTLIQNEVRKIIS